MLLEVDVGPVAHGGHCVARHEGQVVFVRHALPGERVRAAVTSGGPGSRFLRADAVEVLRPSPDRVTPPCPYAGPGRCGGCDWQHVTLAAQRRLKAQVVLEQMRRIANVDVDVAVEEVPGAEDGLGWRTRVRFAVDEEGRAGLLRHRSHDVVPVDRCLIASAGVEAAGVERQRWPGAQAVDVLASATTGELLVVPTPTGGRSVVPAGAALHEHAAGRHWRVSGTGFWQVHPGAAETLVNAVLDGLDPRAGESALDLYCGVGLFAGPLAERLGAGGRVTAVEGSRLAAADARHNLADLATVRVEHGPVDRVLARLEAAQVDLVVLDPPRTGAGRVVVNQIARLRPRGVAYVACDPAALARDIGYFAAAGYALGGLRAFDMFPMTHHVECVAVLRRR